MKTILWRVEYTSPPMAIRYCKKCGAEREYLSSGQFRVNAQQKSLDVWLIYKCTICDNTWNHTLYTRVNPQKLAPELLEQLHVNNADLAFRYAMDANLLRKNGANATQPEYTIIGAPVFPVAETELHLTSDYTSEIRISSVLRRGFVLSSKELERMLDNGKIRCTSGHNLQKSKLGGEIVILIT